MVILYKLVQILTDKIGIERASVARDLDDRFVDNVLVKKIHCRVKPNSIAQTFPKIIVIIAAILSELIRVKPAIASPLNIESNRSIIGQNLSKNDRLNNEQIPDFSKKSGI